MRIYLYCHRGHLAPTPPIPLGFKVKNSRAHVVFWESLRKKTPVNHEYHLGDVNIQCVQEEIDLGVTITRNLTWDSHVMRIVLKANRMLGLLKRTCPLMTDIKVRRTLYLSLVKSQLTYATEVWSPASVNLRTVLERVQRCATRWILRTRIGEMSYKQRLLTLRLLPLAYDREASFFNRIVKPWNTICNLAPQDKFSSLSLFKYFLRATYFTLLDTIYDIDMSCTWFLFRNCPCHRS